VLAHIQLRKGTTIMTNDYGQQGIAPIAEAVVPDTNAAVLKPVPWYRRSKLLAILIGLLLLIMLVRACGGGDNNVATPAAETAANVQESPIEEVTVEPTEPQTPQAEETVAAAENWTTIGTWPIDLQQNAVGTQSGQTPVFTLNGGPVRLIVSQNAEETGSNSVIYLLPEGATVATNAAGEIEVASITSMNIGNQTDTVRPIDDEFPAGSYYLTVNATGISDLSITVEELQQ